MISGVNFCHANQQTLGCFGIIRFMEFPTCPKIYLNRRWMIEDDVADETSDTGGNLIRLGELSVCGQQ